MNAGFDRLNQLVADGEVRTVRLMAAMPDGRLIGKYLAAAHLIEMQPDLPNVSDIIFGLDRANELQVTRWESWRGEMAEVYLDPDLSTLMVDPRLDGMATVLCDLVLPDGPVPECARSQVKRLLGELAGRGLSMKAGFEIEFTAFEEPIELARRKGYRNLTPLGGDMASAYSVTKTQPVLRFMDAVTRRLDQLGLHWESWLDEAGNGQFELNLEPDEALRTADNVTIAKMVLREVAEEHGHCVTFMAKWHADHFGGGLHFNHSLWRGDESAFYDPSRPGARSVDYHHWIGGVMATMLGAQSFSYPNVNSYRRIVELAGAPTTATWGGDNKTTAMRAMSQSPGSARAELRMPGADTNPYLVMAAALAGGLAGLDEELEPPPPFDLMAWSLPPEDGLQFNRSIVGAAEALGADTRLRRWLGDELVDHWIGQCRGEWLAFHTTGGDPDSPLTDWELGRYFENV
jgi:glutamine synthetase